MRSVTTPKNRLATIIIVVLLFGASLAMPATTVARPCADYIDVYAIRAYKGTTCVRAHRVLRALYRQGFNAVPGSRQTVVVRRARWRCRWTDHRYGPLVRCRNTSRRGAFRGLLSVDI